MTPIRYIKTSPTQFVIHYQNGRPVRSGPGLAFFYFQPASSIVIVPVGSQDVPFIFNEISADFQFISLQGQFTYRIVDPIRVSKLLDYSVDGNPNVYSSDDPEKLPQRLVDLVQVLARTEIRSLPLQQAIQASDDVAQAVFEKMKARPELTSLGVEILALSIQMIKANPEMSRALEAEAREALLRQADQAIYDRRNAAVEQERRIKENELNTEIAVEEKKRQIRETRVEAELAVEAREQQVREAKLAGQIRLEEDRKRLVTTRNENMRAEADVQAYAVEAGLRPIQALDARVLELLTVQSADPRRMVTLALKEIAQNAGKIGNLNISPDLLERLLENNHRES